MKLTRVSDNHFFWSLTMAYAQSSAKYKVKQLLKCFKYICDPKSKN